MHNCESPSRMPWNTRDAARERGARRQLRDRGASANLSATSDSMLRIYALIEQVAPSSASVLIRANQARARNWPRALFIPEPAKDSQFVRSTFSAIPETLMESEPVRHEKALSRARQRGGRACFGWLMAVRSFLDEIGEMPTLLQAKCCAF